jgi:hypothetical protein
MGEAGRARAAEFRWERGTVQRVEYYHVGRDRVLAGRK